MIHRYEMLCSSYQSGKNNVLIRIVMLLIFCVVNTSKQAGAPPGRSGTFLIAGRIQPATVCSSRASCTTGFRSLLFFLFSFFSFHVCSAKLMRQKGEGGGAWEGGESNEHETYSSSFCPDREVTGFPAKILPSHLRERGWGLRHPLIPHKELPGLPLSLNCNTVPFCHLTLPSTPSGRWHLRLHFL